MPIALCCPIRPEKDENITLDVCDFCLENPMTIDDIVKDY